MVCQKHTRDVAFEPAFRVASIAAPLAPVPLRDKPSGSGAFTSPVTGGGGGPLLSGHICLACSRLLMSAKGLGRVKTQPRGLWMALAVFDGRYLGLFTP